MPQATRPVWSYDGERAILEMMRAGVVIES
jgi:hypothetical protein